MELTKELIKSLRLDATKEKAETAAIMREAADLLEQLINLLYKAKESKGEKQCEE